ncbi:hypothetical protein [Bosea sp. TAB14]|uniref:hypothetical protein n=1 Tax=Bosea sp. TAB14 TaxID=3237481 RepID=UPI003F91CB37
MAFNFQQPSFMRFRTHYAERRRPIVFWVGAGLSADAGLPNWRQLRDQLIQQALETVNTFDPKTAKESEAKLEQASINENLWDAFQQIKSVIRETEFRETLKSIFSERSTSVLPEMYNVLWGLKNINGVISFNIDGFAARSHSIMRPREDAIKFIGKEAKNYASAISSGRPFIANLHGLKESPASWVFTREEIAHLTSDEGYVNFTSEFQIESSASLRQLDDDEIRKILASEASRIIEKNGGETDNKSYREFLKTYSPNIYQAWHITADEPHNKFFDFSVVERISRSAFSSV